jgi:hypothetical protein
MGCWVHVRCAVWSSEVFEDVQGRLGLVEKAIRRSLRTVR